MTPLKARQERFCRRFVEFGCATTAARAAGYAPKSARNAGYRLIRHPRIAARIAQIEAETARLHSRNSDVLVGKLENVYRRAIVDHQFQAAARAVDLQARIRGFTGQIPEIGEADVESDAWPDMRHADGGRGSRPTASRDIRHARRSGPGSSDF
jgi:phage terminase small subunit